MPKRPPPLPVEQRPAPQWYRHYTEKDDADLLRLRASGLSFPKIARAMGRTSETTVRMRFYKLTRGAERATRPS